MEPRHAAARDPVLLAVDHIAVAAAVGAGRHLAGGAAGPRLGDADGRLVARQHEIGGEPLLRFAAVCHDRADRAHVGLDDDAAGDAAAFRHLLDDQDGVEIARPLPAISCRDRHAHEPGLLQQRHIVPRVLLGAIDLRGALGDAATGQFTRLGLQGALRRCKVELHAASDCPGEYGSGNAGAAR